MILILEILVIFCLFVIIHSYITYPISIFLLGLVYKKNYKESFEHQPNVSIIISAYNEEKYIENTLRAMLSSDYPLEKIEIIVGSDNCTDSTNEIVKKIALKHSNVKLLPFKIRRGKNKVVNDLMKSVQNEIVVFADANTVFHKDAIRNLTKHFVDNRIGGVAGRVKMLDVTSVGKEGSEEKTYWAFEAIYKNLEGKLGIVMGANGGIYAMRRELMLQLPENVQVADDFYVSLAVLTKRKDLIYEFNAVGEETVLSKVKYEFKRKVRAAPVIYRTVSFYKSLLMPHFGIRAYGLWSHKIFRWITPIMMILALILNSVVVFENTLMLVLFILQVAFYLSALMGYLLSIIKLNFKIFSGCYYFLINNVALGIGFIKLIQSDYNTTWKNDGR